MLDSEPRSIFIFSFVLVNSPCTSFAQHTALEVSEGYSVEVARQDKSGIKGHAFRLKQKQRIGPDRHDSGTNSSQSGTRDGRDQFRDCPSHSGAVGNPN